MSIPWILGHFTIRLRIRQCLQPWIIRLGEQHAGYRVGEFWRTRYLAYAERVLIKKKKRRGRGQRGRKCMGQAGYPYVQRVGRQNMWEDHMLLDRFNRNFFPREF